MSADERPAAQPPDAATASGLDPGSPAGAAGEAGMMAPAAAETDVVAATAGRGTPPAAQSAAEAEAAGDARPGVPAVAGVRDDLTADGLLVLLRTTFPESRAHYWGARVDALGPIAAGVPADLAGWSEGRVWGARAEVRWRRAGAERYSALYLGEGETLPDGFRPLAGDLRAVPGAEAEGLFLWGTRGADGLYREPRLPHPLDYAALGATAPEARVPCRLLLGPDGQVRFIHLAAEETA
ncbi:MAG TPA: hypothetical protein VFE37_00325 [Chloroflexota bacterium]|nr:hypothetical protein [Chloroflexota bacterium]